MSRPLYMGVSIPNGLAAQIINNMYILQTTEPDIYMKIIYSLFPYYDDYMFYLDHYKITQIKTIILNTPVNLLNVNNAVGYVAHIDDLVLQVQNPINILETNTLYEDPATNDTTISISMPTVSIFTTIT